MIKCKICSSEEVESVNLRAEEDTFFLCKDHATGTDEKLSVYDLLKRLKDVARFAKAKDIDAANCGTRSDFQRAEEAEVMETLVFEGVEKELNRRIRQR